MVGQAAGRRHDDVRMLLKAADLRLHALPAVQDGDADVLVIGQKAAQLVRNLDGKLPRRRKDQPLQVITGRIDMLDHGDAEGEGLAGAGGRLGNHVLPCKQGRDGLLLHAGRQTHAFFLQSPQDFFADAKLLKCFCRFHFTFL